MITKEELTKLQKLAKLSISGPELDIFTKKLNDVVEMIDSLADVNCNDIEPLRSVCDMQQRTREDVVEVNNISEQLFANIPPKYAEFAKEVKCFIVPKMVE